MTELEEGLIAIGGTIVVGVFLYNKWQEYRAKKSVERAFSSTHDDVLMAPGETSLTGEERHEPSFSGQNATAARTLNETGTVGQTYSASSSVPDNDEGNTIFMADVSQVLQTSQVPVSISSSVSVPITQVANIHQFSHASDQALLMQSEQSLKTKIETPARKGLPVDEMIDCLIPIALTAKVHGEKILQTMQTLRHVGNKLVHFIGLREDGVWEAIAYGNIYVALQAGIQLANRSSTLSEIEFSELVGRLRQFGDEIDAAADVPDMTSVMKSAKALHHFVNQFDAKLSVNIQSNGAPWAINTLLTALERQGFDVRPDGKLVMPDGDGGILFMLSTNVTLAADTTSRLTLLLDVPCVAPQRQGYDAMIAFAKALAARLGGTVVDDSSQPLSDDSLREIASQVNDFCLEMETAGIAAGSTRALRLFS